MSGKINIAVDNHLHRRQPRQRLGILFVDFEQANLAAFRYLVLHMNRIQDIFEYEILPPSTDRMFYSLPAKRAVNRSSIKKDAARFFRDYSSYLRQQNAEDKLQEQPPGYFILLTLARFTDDYYNAREPGVSIIALGSWAAQMAPPSILEFIITLILRESVASISASLRSSVHLGTKGCLFDFTPTMSEVRMKVLTGYICGHCNEALHRDGLAEIVPPLLHVLAKSWLGKSSDPDSPAAVTAKLGYNLFFTKGIRMSYFEQIKESLKTEAVKTVLSFVSRNYVASAQS